MDIHSLDSLCKSPRNVQNKFKVRMNIVPVQFNPFVAFKNALLNIVVYYTILITAQKYTLSHFSNEKYWYKF